MKPAKCGFKVLQQNLGKNVLPDVIQLPKCYTTYKYTNTYTMICQEQVDSR